TLAATTGSVGVYFVAKTALGDWLHRRAMKMGQLATSLDEGFRRNAFSFIVLLRLVPIMPYWASNAVPALFGVRLTTFVAATLIGLLPWTVSFAFFGQALDELVAAQEAANPGCAAAGDCVLDF